MLQSPLALAAILLGGTLTPGPNNLALLDIAARGGRRAALAAIAAIVVGSLVLYGLVHLGLDAWVTRAAWPRHLLLAASASYLAWLGGSIMYCSFRSASAQLVRASPMSALGLLALQFVNPKAWLLMVALSSAARCAHACTATDVLIPPALLIIIPTTSLLCWLLLSVGLQRFGRLDFERPLVQRLAAALLVASALSLITR